MQGLGSARELGSSRARGEPGGLLRHRTIFPMRRLPVTRGNAWFCVPEKAQARTPLAPVSRSAGIEAIRSQLIELRLQQEISSHSQEQTKQQSLSDIESALQRIRQFGNAASHCCRISSTASTR